MGVEGGNSGINIQNVYPQCLVYGGTLGALVQDGVGGQYILSDAHVLALGPTGYYTSGSDIPIVQPSLGNAFPTYVSCPPTALQIAAITVGTLTTVLPLNLNGISTQDAALARAFSGMVTPNQYFINTFSSIPTGSNGHNIVHKGMLVQDSTTSGLHKGKVINAIAKPARITVCTHISTNSKKCPSAKTLVQNTILVSHNLGAPGDSGSLLLTQDTCPQPVGLILAQNSTVDIVQEITPVLTGLQTAGGYSSLSLVPSGCTPTSSQIAANATYDTDVSDALTATPNLQSWITSENIPYVMGIGVDMTTDPARLDVTADDGTTQLGGFQTTDAAYVQTYLIIDGLGDSNSPTGISYAGIPVEVSTIQEADETAGLSFGN